MIDGEGRLSELSRTEFSNEALFQELLARFPSVLRGAAGGSSALLLVRREAPVPEQQGGSGRWSLDHLFVDAEGIPVLVEVKRASDTRARREVVAQMLDYAANGVAYWPAEELQAGFRRTAEAAGADPEVMLSEFLAGDDAEAFWRRVDSNLRSGRIRMVFVADVIAKELRRIVEFLNEQMRPAEVLAIEVEHFTTDEGVRLLNPKLLGVTERATATKSVSAPARDPIDLETWLESLASAKGAMAADQARRLQNWLQENGFRVAPTESQDALAASVSRPGERPAWPLFIRRSTGQVEISLQYLKNTRAFAQDEARAELLAAVRTLPGAQISTTKLTGWPAIPLTELAREDLWSAYTQLLLSIIARLRAA